MFSCTKSQAGGLPFPYGHGPGGPGPQGPPTRTRSPTYRWSHIRSHGEESLETTNQCQRCWPNCETILSRLLIAVIFPTSSRWDRMIWPRFGQLAAMIAQNPGMMADALAAMLKSSQIDHGHFDGSIHGAAKKMVCHGSHQFIPNVSITIHGSYGLWVSHTRCYWTRMYFMPFPRTKWCEVFNRLILKLRRQSACTEAIYDNLRESLSGLVTKVVTLMRKTVQNEQR